MNVKEAIKKLERLAETNPEAEVSIQLLPSVVEFVPYSPITGAKVPATVKLFEVVENVTNRMHWGIVAEHPDGTASIWNELHPDDFHQMYYDVNVAAALLRR